MHATECGEPFDIEYRLRRADGSYRWMLGRGLPLRDSTGRIVKWFGTCTDIGDQKETEESLRQANEKLVEAERLKGEFLANVSHELRTPLTLILAPLESLLAGEAGPFSEAVQRNLETMHNNAVRLLQMVTGLLDFSKLEAGKIEVQREPTPIVAMTRSILEDFEPLMKQKGIMGRLATALPEVVAAIDRYLYERIVFNLLSNAVKFTPEAGQVTVGLEFQGDRMHLSVSDTVSASPRPRSRSYSRSSTNWKGLPPGGSREPDSVWPWSRSSPACSEESSRWPARRVRERPSGWFARLPRWIPCRPRRHLCA